LKAELDFIKSTSTSSKIGFLSSAIFKIVWSLFNFPAKSPDKSYN